MQGIVQEGVCARREGVPSPERLGLPGQWWCCGCCGRRGQERQGPGNGGKQQLRCKLFLPEAEGQRQGQGEEVNICKYICKYFALGMGEGFNFGGWVWLGCGLRWGVTAAVPIFGGKHSAT
jgi:hypothetical protein